MASDTLGEIQRDMAFMGWKGDPASGFSHKEDADGNIVARHHDETWEKDCEEACSRVARLAVLHEIQRRQGERA